MSSDTPWPRWTTVVDGRSSEGVGVIFTREVAEDLYVGAFAAPGFPPLPEKKWSAIVDLCGSSKEYLHEYPVKPMSLPFEDGSAVPASTLERVLALRLRTEGPLLIHCAAGLSRSASVAYGLLRIHYRLEHLEALRRVQVCDESVYPMPETLASVVEWVTKRESA